MSKEFGILLQETREKKGRLQKEMAILLGIELRQYQRFEAGKAWPKVEYIARLSSELEYDFFSHIAIILIGKKAGGQLSDNEDRAYQLRNSAILGTILDAVGEVLAIQKGQTTAQIVGSLEEAVKNKEAILRAQHGEH